LSGRAHVVWEPDEVGRYPGAERLVDFVIDRVHEREQALSERWELIEPSRLNPRVP
jgi:uncharacterized protein